MLAVQNLVAGTKLCNAVGGAILPQNNNRAYKQLEDIHSATVIYSSEFTENVPVGFGIINRYSPNQLYCSLVSIEKEFEKGFVNVAKIDMPESEEEDGKGHHTLLKICDVHHSLPDLSGLPQYFTAFAEPIARPLLQCIVDQLVANCFGTCNMELLRNMTIDLYDSEAGKFEHSDELWRDFCGFLVADRFRYCEIDIKCDSLLSALGANIANCLPSNVTIHQLTASTRSIFHNYDQMVTVMNRMEYLDFLLDLDSAKGVVAIDSDQNQPIGYALGLPGRILQCYGEDEQIAGALLHSLISSNFVDSTSSVSMFIRIGSDHSLHDKILSSAINIRRLRRFHSRIVPTSVKWTKVFCLNVGANLF